MLLYPAVINRIDIIQSTEYLNRTKGRECIFLSPASLAALSHFCSSSVLRTECSLTSIVNGPLDLDEITAVALLSLHLAGGR